MGKNKRQVAGPRQPIIRHKEYGTEARIIRVQVGYKGLTYRIADLTYGGYGFLPVAIAEADWEVVS